MNLDLDRDVGETGSQSRGVSSVGASGVTGWGIGVAGWGMSAGTGETLALYI
jgi:hypothetical protein